MNYFWVAARLLVSSTLAVGPRAGMDPKSPPKAPATASREALEHARDAGDLAAARAHGWQLLTALTAAQAFTKYGVDETVIQSFMAAVQLGLKRRFGGTVDHLRMTLQDEPGRNGGPRRQYVMLYDSVPGGTGYLAELEI